MSGDLKIAIRVSHQGELQKLGPGISSLEHDGDFRDIPLRSLESNAEKPGQKAAIRGAGVHDKPAVGEIGHADRNRGVLRLENPLDLRPGRLGIGQVLQLSGTASGMPKAGCRRGGLRAQSIKGVVLPLLPHNQLPKGMSLSFQDVAKDALSFSEHSQAGPISRHSATI